MTFLGKKIWKLNKALVQLSHKMNYKVRARFRQLHNSTLDPTPDATFRSWSSPKQARNILYHCYFFTYYLLSTNHNHSPFNLFIFFSLLNQSQNISPIIFTYFLNIRVHLKIRNESTSRNIEYKHNKIDEWRIQNKTGSKCTY